MLRGHQTTLLRLPHSLLLPSLATVNPLPINTLSQPSLVNPIVLRRAYHQYTHHRRHHHHCHRGAFGPLSDPLRISLNRPTEGAPLYQTFSTTSSHSSDDSTTSSSSSSSSSSPSLEEENDKFQQSLVGRYAMYVLSKNKRYSAAIKGIGNMEDASKTWSKDCTRLNVEMKSLIDYVHEVPGDYAKVTQRINSDTAVALLVVDMMTHEGKLDRARTILAAILAQGGSPSDALQQQHARLYVGQIHFNEQKVQEARKVAFDLLANDTARSSVTIMRGVLDILTVERPDDPPFYLTVPQMSEILGNLTLVMQKHHLACDFMRLIKRWATPVWEQMNIDNQKHNNRLSPDQSRFDDGNHLTLLLHRFILDFAKLEQVQSELFESQFTMLRRDILTSGQQATSVASISVPDNAVATAIAHQTIFNQASWEETRDEEIRLRQVQETIEEYLVEYGADREANHTQIETDLLHLAMYRPLTRVAGFEHIAKWDLKPFSGDVRQVLKVHVLEPVEQRALVEGKSDRAGATVLTKISSQNASVSEFYTSHIFPAWRSTGRELWPSSIRLSLSMYYGKSLNEEGAITLPSNERVLIAGCGSCHEVAMMALAHPEAKIAALDLSKASLGYGMQRLKELNLDKNIDFFMGDLELLAEKPPAQFSAGFDLISATGVLHHLKNPLVGWRNLVSWLKPDGIMSIGLYSRLARIPCAQLRAEVAQKMEFNPPLFGNLQGSDFVSMIREPTADELRQIRRHVLSSPQYATLAKKSMGEFKDMLCHPQERTYSLPEIGAILENLGLEFLGFMLDDDVDLRKEFSQRFPQDKDMDNLLNWDKYEQEKPWTFSGMYFFHCRKIDKNRQQELYEKYDKQTQENTRRSSTRDGAGVGATAGVVSGTGAGVGARAGVVAGAGTGAVAGDRGELDDGRVKFNEENDDEDWNMEDGEFTEDDMDTDEPHGTYEHGEDKESNAVEANYKEVKEKDTSFKTNSKYK